MMKKARYQLFRLCYSQYSSSTGKKPPISQKVKFIDQLRVVARGGHGGGGSNALFGRTGHYPRAAGGNGAPGGAVILRATKQLTGLGSVPLHVEAARGGSGGKQWMDGKKGPDRVVNVPLGTLVYQLLEVRGINGSSTPHGVTALPHAVQPNSSPGSQPGSFTAGVGAAQPAAAAAAAGVAPDPAGGVAAAQQQQQQQQQVMQPLYWPAASSGSSMSGSNRRRLFQELEERHQEQQMVPAATAAPAADNGACSALSSAAGEQHSSQHSTDGRNSGDSESSRSALQIQAAAAAGDSLEPNDVDDDDALYQQLVSCQRLLANAEKQALLHTGRLPGLAAAAAAADGAHHSVHDAGDKECEGQDTDDDAALSSEASSAGQDDDWTEDEDGWVVYRGSGGGEEGTGGEAWPGAGAGGGNGWQEVGRQFTKQQVWSILESQAVLLCELDQEGQAFTVAGGGRGGRGNGVSPSRPHAPASRVRSDGQPGQEVLLLLRLRLLADVVLVGLPNVGKSSLIAALTHARAQVGSYAFTTLRPQLGTITDTTSLHGSTTPLDTPNIGSSPAALAEATASPAAAAAATTAGDRTGGDADGPAGHAGLVLADLPGLVPGAHAGKGRGTAFLAHLQRARCLALVLDMTGGEQGQQGQSSEQVQLPAAGADIGLAGGGGAGVGDRGSDEGWGVLVPYTPRQQLTILQEELTRYDARVMQLPVVVIANKLDALSPSAANAALQDLKAATHLPIVPVSAKEGLGLQRLKSALQLLVGR